MVSNTRFDENSDLSTTYLGRIDITKASEIKAEGKFPISEQGYKIGKLLDGAECHTLLDTGASTLSCSSHIIYGANLCIQYTNLLLKLKRLK